MKNKVKEYMKADGRVAEEVCRLLSAIEDVDAHAGDSREHVGQDSAGRVFDFVSIPRALLMNCFDAFISQSEKLLVDMWLLVPQRGAEKYLIEPSEARLLSSMLEVAANQVSKYGEIALYEGRKIQVAGGYRGSVRIIGGEGYRPVQLTSWEARVFACKLSSVADVIYGTPASQVDGLLQAVA